MLSHVVDVTLEQSVPDRRTYRPYANVLNFHGANAGTCLHSGSEIRRGWGGVFALARILILCAAGECSLSARRRRPVRIQSVSPNSPAFRAGGPFVTRRLPSRFSRHSSEESRVGKEWDRKGRIRGS